MPGGFDYGRVLWFQGIGATGRAFGNLQVTSDVPHWRDWPAAVLDSVRETMGARIEAADGRPPLTVHGAALHAITHRSDVPSAQVKSAVLLAGLHANGTTTVVEPAQTRTNARIAGSSPM